MAVPVGSNVQNKDSFPIAGLWPGMRYMLRVMATNSAGTTVAEYTVTTLPVMGGNTIHFVSSLHCLQSDKRLSQKLLIVKDLKNK